MKHKIKSFETNKENLFIDTNHQDYKWIKKHYNDPNVSAGEREFVDFDDSFINVEMGKHTLKHIAPNVFPKHATETIVIVGKSEGKDFIVDELVHCRFMYDEPNEYEILGVVCGKNIEYNKDEVLCKIPNVELLGGLIKNGLQNSNLEYAIAYIDSFPTFDQYEVSFVEWVRIMDIEKKQLNGGDQLDIKVDVIEEFDSGSFDIEFGLDEEMDTDVPKYVVFNDVNIN